jgi:hypothetical protein
MPDSKDKEHFLKYDLSVFSNRAMPAAALTFECEIPKIFNIEQNSRNSEIDRADGLLYDVAHVLNVVEGVSCRPYYSTSYNLPGSPMDPFSGSGGGSPVYDIHGYGSSEVIEPMTEEINDLVEAFQKLGNRNKKKFSLILSRFSQAKRRFQLEDKLLDLGISLEMALLNDNDNYEQLALNFRLRGSWLIGESAADREVQHDLFKNIYRYRCEVAHSGELKVKKSTSISEIEGNINGYFSLASKVFKKLILDGHPNWIALLLGK